MLEKNGPTFEVTCDFCPNDLDTGEDDFHMAVTELKLKGWRVFKKDGEWVHKCAACLEDNWIGEFKDER